MLTPNEIRMFKFTKTPQRIERRTIDSKANEYRELSSGELHALLVKRNSVENPLRSGRGLTDAAASCASF